MKGFPSQSKLTEQRYNTIAPFGSDKSGIDVAPKAIFPISIITNTPIASSRPVDSMSGKTSQRIQFGSPHGLRIGDVLRFDAGPLKSVEASVTSVVGLDTVVIPFLISDANILASTCLFMRHVTLTLNESGSLVTTSGPLEYLLDSVSEQVEQDTATPANNRALPTQTFVGIDGVQTPLLKDTATPANDITMPTQLYFERDGVIQKVIKDTSVIANTRAIPVELVSTDGVEATFNITAGDMNIQTTHSGGTPDSMQIGDGTNIMSVTATNDAQVVDNNLNAAVGLIDDNAIIDPILNATLIANGKGQLAELNKINTINGLIDDLKIISPDVNANQVQLLKGLLQLTIDQTTASGVKTQVVDRIDSILFSVLSSTIPASSSNPVQIVASLAADVSEIEVTDDIGEFVGIYTGALGVEVLATTLPLGGGRRKVVMNAGERISLRHLKTTVISTDTFMVINFLG